MTPSKQSPLALPSLTAIKAEQARRSFYRFVKQSWSIVEPAQPLLDGWHVQALCDHLQAVKEGHIRKLLINIPPGHAKSKIVSVCWPAWVWAAGRPSWRLLAGSYASELAIRDSVGCRALLESPWYQNHFADGWQLSGDQNVKSYFTNTATGARLAISVGGRATGFRGNCVMVDDPLNVIDAPSKLKRDECIFWWDKAMSSRVNDLSRDAFVIIMQRLHEDDLAGHVLRQGGYEHLMLPSMFEPERRARTFVSVPEHITHCDGHGESYTAESADPVTGEMSTIVVTPECDCPRRKEPFWQDPRTQEGELLFPKLFPAVALAEAKVKLGSAGFAGQHQQRPAPEDGERFKKGWWRFWRPEDQLDQAGHRPRGWYQGPARVVSVSQMQRIFLSLDATFKDTDGTDFVVFQVWGCLQADRFLLDQKRGRMGFTETCAELVRLHEKWPQARKKLVEDKANGPAVINALKRRIPGLIEVQPEGGKEARAAACEPEIEAGNVYLLDGAPWAEEYVEEFTIFPNGQNDDQVDCTSQALNDAAGRLGMKRAAALAML